MANEKQTETTNNPEEIRQSPPGDDSGARDSDPSKNSIVLSTKKKFLSTPREDVIVSFFAGLTTLLIMTMLLYTFLKPLGPGGTGLIEKNTIHETLQKAILNGADLRALQHLYNDFQTKTSLTMSFKSILNRDAYYSGTTPLSMILERLRASSFISGAPNTTYLAQIDVTRMGSGLEI